MSGEAKQRAQERFAEFLARKNLRLTGPRQAIIESVFSTDQHFTAEELLQKRPGTLIDVFERLPNFGGLVRLEQTLKRVAYIDVRASDRGDYVAGFEPAFLGCAIRFNVCHARAGDRRIRRCTA